MTTNDTPAGAPFASPSTPPSPSDGPPRTGRRLTRSRDQRVIAGVCGGLGRYCGVDPLVFRIALAVLVFFGGVGAAIYVAAWLFLPADGDTASPIEALLGRGESSTSPVTTVILALLGVCAISIAFHGETALLLALAVLGIVLLARRAPDAAGQPFGQPASHPTGPAAGPPPDTGAAAAAPSPVPMAYAPYGPYGGSVGGGPAEPAAYPPPPVSMTKPLAQPPPPKPPRPPKERSALGRIVVSTALLALGLMLAADRLFDVSIAGPAYVAVALAIVGAGLVVGTWYGRARSLIALGIALCIALPVSSAASGWDGPGDHIGNLRWAPIAVADIRPAYDVGFGDGTLDLTNVNFTDASVATRAEVGFGHLLIRVPSNVDVTVSGSAGAGNLNLFGQETNGTDVQRTVNDLGADGAGGGTLKLNVEVGFGAVEVIRD